MDANEILNENGLVITVDGDLRFEKDCVTKSRYDYETHTRTTLYYGDDKWVKDYDCTVVSLKDIEETHFLYDGEWYDRDDYAICEKCGNVVNSCDIHETSDTGKFICEDCGCKCARCDDWYEHTSSLIWVESEESYVCEDCYNMHYFTCEDCDEVYRDAQRNTTRGGHLVCDGCIDDHYRWCDQCDEYVHDDEYDYDNDCCCECCETNGSFKFISYSSKPSPIFLGPVRREDKGEWCHDMGVGCELEITTLDGSTRETGPKIAELVGEQCYYKEDCSINRGDYHDGIEVITHPMKYEYFFNEFPWDDLCRIAREGGYVSHDYNPESDDSCGFHLHFSREYFGATKIKQTMNIAKLLMFFAWCWNDLVKASRRKQDMLHWTKRNKDVCRRTRKQLYEICKEEASYISSHDQRYVAVNLSNRNTVEIRLCRGSLNPKALRAWADLMFSVIHNCCELSVMNIFTDPQRYLKGIRQETREYLDSRKAFLMGTLPKIEIGQSN